MLVLLSSLLFCAVLVSRVFTSAAPFFADAQKMLNAARSGSYVIQAPGYWLLIRTAALFPSPEAGFHILNWSFSSLGAVAFFLLASELLDVEVAFLAAFVYSFIFFNWFAGVVQSSYASQLLFPPLIVFCLLRHTKTGRREWLLASAACFAVGTGLRPSDGVFLIPMLGYYLYRRKRLQDAAWFVGVAGILCLLWFVPQQIALDHVKGVESHVSTQLSHVAFDTSVLKSGLTPHTVANVARYVVPMMAALFPLIFFLRWPQDETERLLWFWVVPGSMFFALIYMGWATYLVFLSGAPILLVCLSKSRFLKPVLAICLIMNVLLFVGFRPVSISPFQWLGTKYRRYAEGVVDVYLGDYTLHAIQTSSSMDLKDFLVEHRKKVNTARPSSPERSLGNRGLLSRSVLTAPK